MTRHELIGIIKNLIAEETGISVDEMKESDSFFNLGLDSVSCIFLMDKLEKKIQLDLNPLYFWDYPNLGTYADFLARELASKHGD
jgi:acyl carrier protein